MLVVVRAAEAVPSRAATSLNERERDAQVARAAMLPDFDERLGAVSAPFLGVPYLHSPLGEGEGVDPDPRLRWDQADCLTFVETVMALAVAGGRDRLLRVLDDVRYVAPPAAFANRNHFIESQWLPNNVRKGYVRDITREIGGESTLAVAKKFSAARWSARRKPDDLPLPVELVPQGTFTLDIVPLPVAQERVSLVPGGTLLFVVRKDLYAHPTRVTHVGLVLVQAGRRVLRHASSRPYGRVVDEPLGAFLARNARYDKWPVEGVALYQLRVPSERLSTLEAAARAPEPGPH
jgi:hypothetical protein